MVATKELKIKWIARNQHVLSMYGKAGDIVTSMISNNFEKADVYLLSKVLHDIAERMD